MLSSNPKVWEAGEGGYKSKAIFDYSEHSLNKQNCIAGGKGLPKDLKAGKSCWGGRDIFLSGVATDKKSMLL